jgi:uncharacterized protein YlxP (DUF503 family)
MYVLGLSVDLHLPACRSLKDRRAVVKPIIDGAHHRFRVTAADVGYADKWQRARLGFAVVAGDEGHAREVIDAVERFVWSFPEVEVAEATRHWMEVES